MKVDSLIVARLGMLAGALLLGACTVMPTGPSVLVMPGTGRSMDNFRYDDNECRQYAYYQIGGVTTQDGLPLKAGDRTNRRVTGRLNDGGPRLSVQTTNGGVRVGVTDDFARGRGRRRAEAGR